MRPSPCTTQLTPHENQSLQPLHYYSVSPNMVFLSYIPIPPYFPQSTLTTCLPIYGLTIYLGNKVLSTAFPTLTLCFSHWSQFELSVWQHCLLLTCGQSHHHTWGCLFEYRALQVVHPPSSLGTMSRTENIKQN